MLMDPWIHTHNNQTSTRENYGKPLQTSGQTLSRDACISMTQGPWPFVGARSG